MSATPERAKEEFIEYREAENASPHTLSAYHYRLKQFVEWCDRRDIEYVDEMTPPLLNQFAVDRKKESDLAKTTIRGQLSTLRRFIRFCERYGYVERNLHEAVQPPSINRDEGAREEMVIPEEAKAILDYLSTYVYASRQHVVFKLMWETGCRVGEAHGLDLDDYNPEKKYVFFEHRPRGGTPLKNEKGGNRIVGISSGLCDVIEDWIRVNRPDVTDDHGREPLFASKYGRITKNILRRDIYTVTRPCYYGKDCPHDRDPESCEATESDRESRCPSSKSPHPVRRGHITHVLRKKHVNEADVSRRANVSADVLKKHYDQRTLEEELEARRHIFDSIFDEDDESVNGR